MLMDVGVVGHVRVSAETCCPQMQQEQAMRQNDLAIADRRAGFPSLLRWETFSTLNSQRPYQYFTNSDFLDREQRIPSTE